MEGKKTSKMKYSGITRIFCIEDSPVCWTHWVQKGILLIGDLYDANNQLKDPVDLGVNWLEYANIVASIPKTWKSEIHSQIVKPVVHHLYTEFPK